MLSGPGIRVPAPSDERGREGGRDGAARDGTLLVMGVGAGVAFFVGGGFKGGG